jgi:hypothetical protein
VTIKDLLALLVIALIVHDCAKGQVRSQTGLALKRAEHPVQFWILMPINVIVGVALLILVLYDVIHRIG